MNQQFQRRARPAHAAQQQHRQEHGDEDMTLDQYAGAVARQLIKQTGVEDSTQIWRALKRAYLTGYDEASR